MQHRAPVGKEYLAPHTATSNLVLVTIDLDENPFDVEVDAALDSNSDIFYNK